MERAYLLDSYSQVENIIHIIFFQTLFLKYLYKTKITIFSGNYDIFSRFFLNTYYLYVDPADPSLLGVM